MQEQPQSQIVLQQQQSHQLQQSQQIQQQNQQIQQQNQQNQQIQQQIQQQNQQIQQQQLQQQAQQIQQAQSIPQHNQQLQQPQQISTEVALSGSLGTMSVQVAPQSTMTAVAAGSMAIQIPQSISSIAQSGLQQQSGTTTITTMSTLQQQQALGTDWTQGRVQVIQQQPMQNAAYLQQLYNPPSQLLMQGNLALHSTGVNPGSIQVIAAGKPFQQTGPHILTQGKQVIAAQGQTASFPGYTTIPTTNSQTLVIGQLGVISSQPNILPAQATNGQSKQDLQKYAASCNRAGTVQPTQPMQFSPWQFGTTSLPQNIWATSPQQPTLLTTQNSIFIRGATPQDAAQAQQQTQHMFIQSPPPQQLQHHTQGVVSQTSGTVPNLAAISQQDVTVSTSIAGVTGKPRGSENIQPKSNLVTSTGRPPLLPNLALRPASSVSTQTAGTNNVVQSMSQKSQAKIRAKSVIGRGVGIKTDPNNLNKSGVQQVTASRMILASHGTLVAGTQTKVMQQQQQQQQQQHSLLNIQQQINVQQQQQISFQQQQIIQSRPSQIMVSSVQQQNVAAPQHIQQIGQSQPQIISDRPVVPVLSVEALQNDQTSTPNQLPLQTSLSSLVVPPQLSSISPQLPVTDSSMVTDSTVSKSKEGSVEKMEVGCGPETSSVLPNKKTDQETVNGSVGVSLTNGEKDSKSKKSANTNGMDVIIINGDVQAPLDDSKERNSLPKAMVKPQLTNVLTHVIEGFVIQEASEPFPVNRSLMSEPFLENGKDKRIKLDAESLIPSKKSEILGSKNDYGKCEFCGKVDLKSKFKKSKRFCSMLCAKRFNANDEKPPTISVKDGADKKQTDNEKEKKSEISSDDLGISGLENRVNTSNNTDSVQLMEIEDSPADSLEVPKVNPLKWTVTEVCEFIKALPGCCEYAEDFAVQEIDGQALMLLREDHLMSAMSMKLGPALKIVAKIDLMRETKTENQSNSPEK